MKGARKRHTCLPWEPTLTHKRLRFLAEAEIAAHWGPNPQNLVSSVHPQSCVKLGRRLRAKVSIQSSPETRSLRFRTKMLWPGVRCGNGGGERGGAGREDRLQSHLRSPHRRRQQAVFAPSPQHPGMPPLLPSTLPWQPVTQGLPGAVQVPVFLDSQRFHCVLSLGELRVKSID